MEEQSQWDVVSSKPAPPPASGGEWDVLSSKSTGAPEQSGPTDSGRTLAPPPPARPPLPAGLMTPEQTAAEEPLRRSRTGQLYRSTPMGSMPLIDSTIAGPGHIVEGVEQLAAPAEAAMKDLGRSQSVPTENEPEVTAMTPELRKEAARGVGKVISGTLESAQPLMVAGGAVAPVSTALTIGSGVATDAATKAALKHYGVDEAYADLAGSIVGLLAGYGAAHGRLTPEQTTLVEALRGESGGDRTIDALKAMVDRGGTENERTVAQAVLKRKYGIDYGSAAAPATPPKEAAAPPAEAANQEATPQPSAAEQRVASGPPPPEPDPLEEILARTPVAIQKGKVYQVSDDTRYQVLHTTGTSVMFDRWESGQRTPGAMPRDQFQAMVAPSGVPASAATSQPEPEGTAATAPPPGEAIQPATPSVATPTANLPDNISPERSISAPPSNAVPTPPPGASSGTIAPQSPPAEAGQGQSGIDVIRGSTNIPLSEQGRAEARDLAKRTAGQFDKIYTTTMGRGQETAAAVASTNPQAGAPVPIPALTPWFLGQHEGQPTHQVIEQINDLILHHPDEPVPGRGPASTSDGQSFNQFKGEFLGNVQNQVAHYQLNEAQNPDQKILNVTHYRDIRLLQSWIQNGAKPDFSIDTAEMTSKGDTKPGDLYRFDPDKKTLTAVKDASKPGIYFARHGATAWNAENQPTPPEGTVGGDVGGKWVEPAVTAAEQRVSGPSEPLPDNLEASVSPSEVAPADSGRSETARATAPETGAAVPAEAPAHSNSSTQTNLPPLMAKIVKAAAAKIPDSQIGPDGRETEPHITVKYRAGDDPESIRALLAGEGPITAKLGKASLFSNEDADVLKVDVDSPDLHRLNSKIAAEHAHPDDYPEYKPHVTIAYLKPGEGKRYAGKAIPGITGKTITLNSVTFSGKNDETTEIPLTGAKSEVLAPGAEGRAPDAAATTEKSATETKPSRTETSPPITETKPLTRAEKIAANEKRIAELNAQVKAKAQPPIENNVTAVVRPAPPGPIPSGTWMNRYDVDRALEQYKNHPVLGPATRFLEAFVEEANANSDGWHSWPLPGHAAKQLMGMIQHPEYATEDNYRKALAPIKTFYTKRGNAAGMKFPETGVPEKASSASTAARDEKIRADNKRITESYAQQNAAPGSKLPADYPTKAEAQAVHGDLVWRFQPANHGQDVLARHPARWIGTKGRLPVTIAIVPAEAPAKSTELAPSTEILERFPNKEDGTEAVVAKIPKGFSVVLRDTDADQAVGIAHIYPTREQATAKAQEIAGVAKPAEKPILEEKHVPAEPTRPGTAKGSGPLAQVPPNNVGPTHEPEPVQSSSAVGNGPDAGVPSEPGGTGNGLQSSPGEEPSDRVPSVRGGRPRTTREPAPSTSRDYRITPEDHLGEGGEKAKARGNLEAIRTLKKVVSEGRLATPEEQAVLAKYVGWGSLSGVFDPWKREWSGFQEELKELVGADEYEKARASTKNAHYTSPDVVTGIWKALQHLGITEPGVDVLEPSMGTGNFFGLMPEELLPARRTGVELDPLTGGIAKLLYPSANVQVMGFEKAALPNNYFDAAVGNVPFGSYGVHDPSFRRTPFVTSSIHNYFFAKALDKVRPGGIVAFVTSSFTMDAKSPTMRNYLASRANLLGAIRLPGGKKGAFAQNAGTEVTTDILFLQKRAPQSEATGEKWTDLGEVAGKDDTGKPAQIPVNEYYAKHPDMMLGEMALQGTMYGPEKSKVLLGEMSPQALESAAKKMQAGVYETYVPESKSFDANPIHELPNAGEIKNGGFGLKDGNVILRSGDTYSTANLSAPAAERVKGMMGVRDAVRSVFRTQLQDAPKAAINSARTVLNRQYDAFVKKHGPLNSPENIKAFFGDPDAPLLSSLEDYNRETNTGKKRPVFNQRTIEKYKPVEKVEKPSEALAVSLAESGRVDWMRMQELTGNTPREMQQELSEQGLLFRNPEGQHWETADDYLSGDVRAKLAVAENAAATNPTYEANVQSLRAVQPKDLTPRQINARLGASWIPTDDIRDFVAHLLFPDAVGWAREENLKDVQVGHAGVLGNWSVRLGDRVKGLASNTNKWGHDAYAGHELVEKALNLQYPTIRMEVPSGEDGKSTKLVVDKKATLAAQEKQDKIKQEFGKWLWSDQDRAGRLAQKYNTEFNNLRLREYNGGHLTFPGMARLGLRNQDLDPHQKNAIWRVIQGGNTLLAHVVGAGKTFEMIGAAMELRRMGLIKKPMFVVPNHLVEQWGGDFVRLYPAANVFVAGKDYFSTGNRQAAMSRIATGNYDAVIVAHRSFQFLPVSDGTFNAFMQEQLHDINQALSEAERDESASEGNTRGRSRGKGKKSPTIKQLEAAKARIEKQIEDRAKRETQDKTLSFEELGVDHLFVDEAHMFKNLYYPTKMTRVAGLPNSQSDRAMDMFIKTQYLTRLHNGKRGVVFATGTPISNSMAEMFTMQRYLQMEHLKNTGMQSFDSWAQNFGEPQTGMELAPEGTGYRINTRFSKFINLPELLTAFRTVADVKNAADLKLPRPSLKTGKPIIISVPGSPELKTHVEGLGERAAAIRSGKVRPDEDNMLAVVGSGRKAALDMRLIDPSLPDNPGSKVNLAVRKVAQIWKESQKQKSTQLMFLDMGTPRAAGAGKQTKGAKAADESDQAAQVIPEDSQATSVYQDIRNKLIAQGIPAKEIKFIHDAKDDAAKQRLFDDVNNGRVRVLLGSTEKMGAGMNVQRKLLAAHHLDAPWRPSDLDQRNGRIERQGNENAEVQIYNYVTEGSFDSFMWQTILAKAQTIAQAMSGDMSVREIQDIGITEMTAAEAMSAGSGSPEIRERIGVQMEVRKLESLAEAHEDEKRTAKYEVRELPGRLKSLNREKADWEAIVAKRESFPKEQDPWKVNARGFEPKDATERNKKIVSLALKMVGEKGNAEIGTYKGFPIVAVGRGSFQYTEGGKSLTEPNSPDIEVGGLSTYTRVNKPEDVLSMTAGIRHTIDTAPGNSLAATNAAIDKAEKRFRDLQSELDKPFEYAGTLAKLQTRLQELNDKLDIGKADSQALEMGEESEQSEANPASPQQNTEPSTTAEGSPEKNPAQKKEVKPKVSAVAAHRREIYTPGNVIYVDYWKQYDKVLKYEEKDGDWKVQVQKSDKEGNPIPGESPRWHHTEPGKDQVVKTGISPIQKFAQEETGTSTVGRRLREIAEKKLLAAGNPAGEASQQAGSRQSAMEALKSAVDEASDKHFGEKVRTFVTGERDIRIAETNQLRDLLRDMIPNHIDQEAITLMRDFKNRPGEMEQFLNGTHPAYDGLNPEQRAEAMGRVAKLAPVIDRAMNPSPDMRGVDDYLTGYFEDHLAEGKKLGFLKSNITNEEYITHLLQLQPEPNKPESRIAQLARGKLGPRKFKFSQERHYPTVLHAVVAGKGRIGIRSINALDALGVYGEKYATTAAYHLLLQTIKATAAGKWGSYSQQRSGKIPSGWVELAPESRIFRTDVPFVNEEGEADIAHRMLFVPPKLEEAMRPILDPNYMNRVAGFQSMRSYQAYIKAVELGLSFFHLRALNMAALGNANLHGAIETYMSDMDSPEFQMAELSWIRAGLVTPVLGKTVEVYKALQPSSLPTTAEKIRSLPGLKHLDQSASAISHLTFGIVQRKMKVTDASIQYAAWLAKNPDASPGAAFEAQRQIAKEVNATYGGLNWENIGVHRTTLELDKALFLAPDWTYSNILNLKYAGEGGPGGKAARLFWLRSIVFGLALTAGMSLAIGGKLGKDPTQVYMGKDREGNDLNENVFFAGAPGDLSTLIHGVIRYGAVVGLARMIAGKLGPFGKAGIHLGTNTDMRGRPITAKTTNVNLFGQKVPRHQEGFLEKTGLGAEELARDVTPIPFSLGSIVKMLLDPKHHYNLGQYVTAATVGREPQVSR